MCFDSLVFRSGSISHLRSVVKGFVLDFFSAPHISSSRSSFALAGTDHPGTVELDQLAQPSSAGGSTRKKGQTCGVRTQWRCVQLAQPRGAPPSWGQVMIWLRWLADCATAQPFCQEACPFWSNRLCLPVRRAHCVVVRDNEAYYATGLTGCQEVF